MEAMPRPDWDDNRLDDLNRKVDRIDARVDALGREMNDRFAAMNEHMNARFDAMQRDMGARFDAMQRDMGARFDSIQRSLFHGAVALCGSILVAGSAVFLGA